MYIDVPPHAITSSSGVTWLDESGIIIAVGTNHSMHTIEHAQENHKVNMQLAGDIRRPFLIDMTDVKTMSPEARAFYAGPEPPKALTAVAILTTSRIGSVVGNIFLLLTKPTLPTRLFTDYNDAMTWLWKYKVPDARI